MIPHSRMVTPRACFPTCFSNSPLIFYMVVKRHWGFNYWYCSSPWWASVHAVLQGYGAIQLVHVHPFLRTLFLCRFLCACQSRREDEAVVSTPCVLARGEAQSKSEWSDSFVDWGLGVLGRVGDEWRRKNRRGGGEHNYSTHISLNWSVAVDTTAAMPLAKRDKADRRKSFIELSPFLSLTFI